MTKIVWTKSESREVRPFFSVEDYGKSLDKAEIQLFEGQAFSAAEAYLLQPDELDKVTPTVRFNLALPPLKEQLIARENLTLLVCLSAQNLKKTVVVTRVSLNENPPEHVHVTPEVIDSVGGCENLIVKLGICLNRDIEPAVGRPFLEGHWIARKSFRLRPIKQSNQFEVRPRTDSEWREIGYPEKTLYLVEYASGMNEPVSPDAPIASVWIHADLYNRLASEVESKKSKALMGNLSAEITVQLISQSFEEWESSDAATPRSPLSALLKQLSAAEPLDLGKLKSMVKQLGQPRLRALVHNQQGTVRAMVEA